MTEKRQRQLLAVLILVLVAVGARSVLQVMGSGSGGGGRRAATLRGGPTRDGLPEAGPEIVRLRLDDLEQKPGEFQPGRDPFRFRPKERAPAPPPPPPPPKPAATERKPRPPRATQRAKPRPPEPAFKFLGSFGPRGRLIAVFSDNVEIFNVAEGDVFKEAFVVKKIGYESADIGWVDFPDEPAKRLEAGG